MSVREKIEDLIDEGLSPAEISKLTGYNYTTVFNAMNPELIPKIEVAPPVERPKGWNKNRKACKKCRYRGRNAGTKNKLATQSRCDFIVITGHMRGCKAEDCNRFEEGKKISLNPKGGWNEGMGNHE